MTSENISNQFKSLKEIDSKFFDEIQNGTSCDWCEYEVNRYRLGSGYGKLVLCGTFKNDNSLKVLFLGLAPSHRRFDNEVRAFFPRSLSENSSGALFLKSLIESGFFEKFDIYITNLVKCSNPINEIPSNKIISQNLPILKRELVLIKPNLIVAMGNSVRNYVDSCLYDYLRNELKCEIHHIHHPSFFLRGNDPKGCLDELVHLKDVITWQFH